MTFPMGPLIPITIGLLVLVLLMRAALNLSPRKLRRIMPRVQLAISVAVTLRIAALLILGV